MAEHLFIYGTLTPGRPNAHVLADVPGTWTPAVITGRLVAEGWGATHGYPGIVLDGTPDRVGGFVFTSDELGAHWSGSTTSRARATSA